MTITQEESTGHPSAALRPRLVSSTGGPRGDDDRHMRVEGSLAFVDISGFTTLTERLARKGKVGAEEMSDILSATFAGLLTEARADGADLVKWGGDAVLLLFQGPDHALRAARAAHRMRADAAHDRPAARPRRARSTLRMSVGIHSGEFDFFLVGDPDDPPRAAHQRSGRQRHRGDGGGRRGRPDRAQRRHGRTAARRGCSARRWRGGLAAALPAPALEDIPAVAPAGDAASTRRTCCPPPIRAHLLERRRRARAPPDRRRLRAVLGHRRAAARPRARGARRRPRRRRAQRAVGVRRPRRHVLRDRHQPRRRQDHAHRRRAAQRRPRRGADAPRRPAGARPRRPAAAADRHQPRPRVRRRLRARRSGGRTRSRATRSTSPPG